MTSVPETRTDIAFDSGLAFRIVVVRPADLEEAQFEWLWEETDFLCWRTVWVSKESTRDFGLSIDEFSI
jgi:hypothetical protein